MLPEAFVQRMQEMLGDEYELFAAGFEGERHHALRLNRLKKNQDGVCATPEQLPFALEPVPWAADGYYYGGEDHPGKHAFHEAGLYYIQEPSAMAPVSFLGVQPGERILDLCAAPGGKSTQIAALLGGKGLLVCNEIHPARAKILSENVERMGIRNACVTNETPAHLSEVFVAYFDRILVDAPCSGEGMFRKNDNAGEEWSPENVQLCAERQDEILDCAARMLRPGGQLVYSTCTFAPAENEGSISRFIRRNPDFTIVPIAHEGMSAGRADWVSDPVPGLEGTLRLWPHRLKGEGHFVALLQKNGTVPEDYEPMAAGGTERSVNAKELGELPAFVKDALRMELDGIYLKYGDNIYLAPANLPALKGLKVLRPGLQLGTLKKNRFEPSHALALAMNPAEAVHTWELSSDQPEVSAYLNGQTFPADGEKGWYLITVDGFGLGWGKLAGGIMKNHYPKGLRK